jgi:hypothetical protein
MQDHFENRKMIISLPNESMTVYHVPYTKISLTVSQMRDGVSTNRDAED